MGINANDRAVINQMRTKINQLDGDGYSPTGTQRPHNHQTVPFLIVAVITAKSSDPNQYEWQEVVRVQQPSSSSTGYSGYEHNSGHRSGTVANNGFCYDIAPFGNAVQIGDHVVLMRTGFKLTSSSSGGSQYTVTWLIIGKENLEYVGWIGATATGGTPYPPNFAYSLYANSSLTTKIADNVAVWRAAPTRVLQVYATAAPSGSKVKYWWDTSGGSPVPVITQIPEVIVTQICAT